MKRHRITAFVFAGGGGYGAVQVGMLRALAASDVRPDLVAGSSVGAINGAFYAGMPTIDGVAKLDALWRGLKRQNVFPIALRSLLTALFSSDHLFTPSGLHRLLDDHLPYARLEESAIPVHVMATDLLTGSPVRLSAGPATEAILASCAIPAIYPPVRIEHRTLVDGAISCNTPIRDAIELGATRLIIFPTAFACPHASPPRGVFASAFHAMGLFVMQQLNQDMQRYANEAEIYMVPPVCPLRVAPYDFSSVGRMIELAAQSTERWIRNGGLSPAGVVVAPHRWVAVKAGQRASPTSDRETCPASLPSCPTGMSGPLQQDQSGASSSRV
jgi:NTE family protein